MQAPLPAQAIRELLAPRLTDAPRRGEAALNTAMFYKGR